MHSFFSPMIKYIINWFKTAALEESVYVGYKIGYYGIVGLILIDPIVGVMYYLNIYFHKNMEKLDLKILLKNLQN